MTADERLAEIDVRANAATSADKWEHKDEYLRPGGRAVRIQYIPHITAVAFAGTTENAEFIAHARTDVPALTAALRVVLALHKSCDNDAARTPTCQTCHGKAGVWECGCWADEDRVRVCSSCTDVEPVHNGHGATPWPCPTVRAITAALGGAS